MLQSWDFIGGSFAIEQEWMVTRQMGAAGSEQCTIAEMAALQRSLDDLRAELEATRLERDNAAEDLRETLAAMIQHQQVGKCGNFRYNAATGAITGSEEVFKIFRFPPGTQVCTVEEWLAKVHIDDRPRVERQFFEMPCASSGPATSSAVRRQHQWHRIEVVI
jgi:hypothetical protein